MKETLAEARKVNPAITLEDVKVWKEKFIPRKAAMRGFNSYIAPRPLHNFQVDMCWYKYEQPDAPVLRYQTGRKYTAGVEQYGILAVDSFTKYAHIESLDRKGGNKWVLALKAIFNKIGYPKQIFSDPDSSLNSNAVQTFFKNYGIEHIQTKEHAPIAERTIKTIKMLLDKRMEDNPKIWTLYLPAVLKNIMSRGYIAQQALLLLMRRRKKTSFSQKPI